MFSLNRLFKLMTSAIFNAGALAFFISGGIFMLISIAVILLCGLLFGGICKRLCFPALIGMIIAGVLIGPYGLNIIDDSILSISSELRRIALIIILIRAGLKLDLRDLKKAGRPALLMCFVPACFEMAGTVVLAPVLLGISVLDAAILGTVICAVSPAVVVPRMIRLIDEKYGTEKGIPQMILAGASVDDVFVIVIFTTFTGLAKGEDFSWISIINIPVSILTGIAFGILAGLVIQWFFEKFRITNVTQVIIIFALSFAMNWAEEASVYVPFAGLIAIMSMGIGVKRKSPEMAKALSGIFDKLWIPAEIFLFILVGASVAIDSAKNAGLTAVLLIIAVLLFRMAGVFVCMLGTKFSLREKLFCMLAYTPKATVQAAIGGLPLAMGLECGQIVLTISVAAIIITAPLGAFLIDLTYKKLLSNI